MMHVVFFLILVVIVAIVVYFAYALGKENGWLEGYRKGYDDHKKWFSNITWKIDEPKSNTISYMETK